MAKNEKALTAASAQNQIMAWLALAHEAQQSRAFSHIDQHLIAGPCAERPEHCVVIFNHIPKTGGETVEHVIAANERINEVLHVNRPVLIDNPAVIAKLGRIPQVIMGHHPLNSPLYGFVDRPLIHLTMLRDPVARVWSWIRYIKLRGDHKMHAEVRDADIGALLRRPELNELHNAQTRRLCGCLNESQTLSDQAMVDLALHNLQQRFSMFGLTEFFDHSMLMFADVLGWSHPYYRRMNVTPKQQHLGANPGKYRAQIEANNALDCEVYARAKTLFLNRAERYAGTRLQRYRIRNRLWGWLAMNGRPAP